jgi:cell division septation protein DedD
VESSSLNPLVTAEFENNRKAVDEAAIKISDSSFTAKPPETITAERIPAVPVEKHYYCVITGSFKSEANAITHVNKLKEQGFEPEISQAASGFFRVIAIKCADMETALSKKDSIAGKFPDTWISKR